MKNRKRHLPVDLHLHSTASDGALTPTELIAAAAGAGLAAVALTDHDTLDGVTEALAAGLRHGLEVVPGVEISVAWGEQEIHILGYDPLRPEKIEGILKELRCERYRRLEEMVLRLRSLGIAVTAEEVVSEAEPAAPGRLHLARLMVKRGQAPGIGAAFSLYLGRGRPAYVPRRLPDPGAAMDLLHEAGAVPVMAHPGVSGKALLRKLLPLGLRGVEVVHPDHSPELVSYYRHRAQQLGLLITGGSDFHSHGNGPAGRLGRFSVPYRCLQALKEAPRGISRPSMG